MSISGIQAVCCTFLCLLLANPLLAGDLDSAAAPDRVFFPFDNGLTDIQSAEEQVALLKELGYDGICTRPKNASKELFAALDRHGLKPCATYVVLNATQGSQPVPQPVVDHINQLQGRDTIVWLGLSGSTKATDEVVLQAIHQVADLARTNGLRVALYPHAGFYTDTAITCLRLAKQADRPDVGISFTLCHFLRQNDEADLETTLRAAAPYLKLVQISGADRNGESWEELIQPLGDGDFDVGRVLRTLDDIGYQGPVNLQCYQIQKPARTHLSQSMGVWEAMNSPLRETPK